MRNCFVVENRSVTDRLVVDQEFSFNVCVVKDQADADSPCGATYRHCTKNGTNSVLRHLMKIHRITV